MKNNQKIGLIGSGDVAQTLASGFLKHGHQVTIGTRDTAKLAEWQAANPKGQVGSFADAAKFGEAIILAVKGTVVSDALGAAGSQNLAGKVIIDATNPIKDEPPKDGVLQFFTNSDQSLMERLQREFPEAHFVKAFNSVGSGLMVNPQFKGGPPTMFICGNDNGAKHAVSEIIVQFGWEPADMGNAISARAIEPLCILWCLPGFRSNEWTHAFKVLKP
jgi:predicted dinucleotide-binding enzyme